MSIIVYGTWCNPTPQFGLSFYCQGSTTACNIFRNFSTVSCLSQSSQLYCTNQQTCGGANITNDIYIEYPSTGPLTATDYDTVTRSNYQFNRIIAVAAYATSSASRRYAPLSNELVGRTAPVQPFSQTVLSTFQNIYNRNSSNPTKLLVNSLASTLFTLNVTGGAASSTALQNKIRDALFAALSSSVNTTITEVQQCRELNATADGMSSVNKQFITNITREIPQPSLATWLLTNFVGHIIANSAVAEEVDIIKAKVFSPSASTCVPLSVTSITSSSATQKSTTPSSSSTSSKSSSITPKPTSSSSSSTSSKSSTASSMTSTKSSTLSSTTASKTSSTSSATSTSSSKLSSTISKSSTSSTLSKSSTPSSKTSVTSHSTSTSTSSRTSTSSTTSTSSSASQPVYVSSFTTHACPSATPTGSPIYKSNSTQNQALNGSFAMYNGSVAHLQNVLLAPVNASSALYSFPDGNTIALTLPDGETLIYTGNATAITYLEAGCGTALKFYDSNASLNGSTASRVATRDDLSPRQANSGVSVVMSVTDQCGNPVTSGYTLQLDCAEVLYPQTNAASGPVVEPPTPEIFDNTGGGTYTAVCDLSGLDSSNTAYNTCTTEDRQSFDNFCGKQLSTVHDAKDYIEDWIKDAKEFASLAKYAKLVGEVLEKTNPALSFWDRMCDKQWGLENPYVQMQFDAEDCGYPAALSMALEGTNGGTPFTSPLGTFAATPTTVYLATTTSLTSTSCCGGAPPKATPDYVSVSSNCSTYSAGLGKAVFCCSGACLDGTSIGQPGQCEYWLDLCGDAEGGAPSCSANQVLSYGDPPSVASGDGCCGACCCECQFQRNNWSYSCCDCPAGYQAVDRGACDGSSSQCVGCADPRLTLVQAANGTYSCVCKG